MSLLAPLYVLGLAAISLPILFHLIRRTPRGRQLFSSLMFLAPSPPRLTRRSRIEHWLLLLLRAAALSLLAFAFARPFLRQAANLSLEGVGGRKVAILLDTSASMRRGNLWTQARQKLEQTLAALEPADDVAFFTFDSSLQPVVDFDEGINTNRQRKPDLIRQRVANLEPSWAPTNLGAALVSTAELLAMRSDREPTQQVLQMVLISDLQQGAELKELQAFEWPAEVFLAIESVHPANPSNASLGILAADEESQDRTVRVRINNAADATADQFQVGWASDQPSPAAVPIYVPAGQSRVVQLALPEGDQATGQLVLSGDADDFDNTYFVVPQRQDEVDVLYVGTDDAEDPDGLQYYLRMAFGETPQRKVNVYVPSVDEPLFASVPRAPRLVVVTAPLAGDQLSGLEQYLQDGGLILAVPSSPEAAASLVSLSKQLEFVPGERGTREDGYLMLADIDFAHPLFATFANPRYSDFTKIHFWNHQRFSIQSDEAVRIIARFDNGDPAVWEQAVGPGKLLVFASGWHPDDSQLALSSKFVPLLNTLLDQAAGTSIEMPSFLVQDPVPLPSSDRDYAIAKPDGSLAPVAAGSEWFREAHQPGIYAAAGAGPQFQFAVNVAPTESNTAPLDAEQLEQFGVRLGKHRTQSEESDLQRQLRDIELESQQQLWRWLIVAVLGVLALETWLAGRRSRAVHREQTHATPAGSRE